MRATKRQFSSPLKEPLKPPEKPIGHDTTPSRAIVPLSGSSVPAITLSSVDLPAPFLPKMPTLVHGGNENETASSTTLGPERVSYAFVMRFSSIMTAPGAGEPCARGSDQRRKARGSTAAGTTGRCAA